MLETPDWFDPFDVFGWDLLADRRIPRNSPLIPTVAQINVQHRAVVRVMRRFENQDPWPLGYNLRDLNVARDLLLQPRDFINMIHDVTYCPGPYRYQLKHPGIHNRLYVT